MPARRKVAKMNRPSAVDQVFRVSSATEAVVDADGNRTSPLINKRNPECLIVVHADPGSAPQACSRRLCLIYPTCDVGSSEVKALIAAAVAQARRLCQKGSPSGPVKRTLRRPALKVNS